MTSHDLREQAIREQAAEWAIRLAADDITPEQALALQEWCACDPRHTPALDFALSTWADLGQLGTSAPMASAVPLPPAARPLRGRRRPVWRRVTRAAAVAALVWFGINVGPGLLIPLTADYASHTGEVRHISLPDGSSVVLDTDSAIDLAYDEHERRIRLRQGEAVFNVAPMTGQETRPFIVESAGGTTRALGTRFVVSESADSAWVGVLEHSVELAMLDRPDNGILRDVLEEGQSARYDAIHGITRLSGQDVQRATSWQRGLLIFDQVPLAQVVDQLNRYRNGHIMITDRQLAQRKVSGVFRLESLDSAVPRLSTELHARHVELPGVSLIY
ncbi:FecR family protein [Pseudomonas sp. NPDC089734]|uniref:FecR family protein n=1 Tax=Pseudomonas sp. NPDC089734 TaxID=3364469 RepID=UPI003829214C